MAPRDITSSATLGADHLPDLAYASLSFTPCPNRVQDTTARMDVPPFDNADQHGSYYGQYSPQLGFSPLLVSGSQGPVPFQLWNQASHTHHGHPTPIPAARHQFAHPVMMPPAFYTPSSSRKRPAFTWDENEPPINLPLTNDSRKRQNTNSNTINAASTLHTIYGSSTSDSLSPPAPIASSHLPQTTSKRASPRSIEEKVDSALVGIQTAGFEGLSHFLAALFNGSARHQKQKSCQSLHKFLTNHNGPGRRPADIVQAIYEHPYSRVGRKEEPFHDAIMPDYAYPLDLDVPEADLAQPGTPAQATLNSWVAKMALKLVNGEAEALATEKSFRLPANWTWDAVTSLSLGDIQKRMVKLAPLTWSIIATVAVSPHRRLRSKNARSGTAEEIDAKKSDLEHASHSPWKVSPHRHLGEYRADDHRRPLHLAF